MSSSKLQADEIITRASTLRWEVGENFHDSLIESIYQDAAQIADRAVTRLGERKRFDWDRALDKLLTSRWTGFPIMLLLLTAVFWITIAGANIPSALLATFLLDTVHPILKSFATNMGIPWWLDGVLIDGVYLSAGWVISVMLPPMAIFFPMFTLLEDFGYLPRVAFNLDNMFRKAGAHGKQALTMSMGYGCNAAGVIATRVIDSPRERLIAIITNNLSASAIVAVALLGVALTFLTSWFLSRTLLKGEASSFSLELPPYRPPRILQTLYTSLIDRTIFVLWRAVVFAVPAGAVIWLVSNVHIAEMSIAEHIMQGLNPFGFLIGLNGVILLAYIIAIPANEIVIPTILMLTVLCTGVAGYGEGAGVMFELEDNLAYMSMFHAGGWTLLTAINLMLFSLVHNPCSTTLYTIYKETGSVKWTAISGLLPVVMGLTLCFLVAQIWRLLSGVG
jgi:ferrous iron transport protein B